jgi:FtsH-binding integral membrane protein
MGNPTILIGIGLVTFALIYMFFKLGQNAQADNNHFALQLLFLFLILSCFTLVGKVALDDKDFCSWNVVNSTVSGYTTTYGYEYQCETNPATTSEIFYKVSVWIFRLVGFYVFVYMFWWALKYFGVVGGAKFD